MALCFTMFWSDYSSWLGRGRGRGGEGGGGKHAWLFASPCSGVITGLGRGRGEEGRKARMALCFTMFWSDYSSWLGRERGEGREESTHGSLFHHVLEWLQG